MLRRLFARPFAILLAALFGLSLVGAALAARINGDPVAATIAGHVWADMLEQPEADGLMIGSSSIALMDWRRRLDCGAWVNRGVGGSTVEDLLTYLSFSAPDFTPSRVLVYAGENDLARDAPLGAVTSAFDRLISAIRSRYGDVELLVLPVKLSPRRRRAHAQFIAFNAWLSARAAVDARMRYLGSELSAPEGAALERAFRPDGVHLTARGYEIFLAPFNAQCADQDGV